VGGDRCARIGYADTRNVLAQAPWSGEFDPLEGLILHEAQAGKMMFEG
jgi:NTE family protein